MSLNTLFRDYTALILTLNYIAPLVYVLEEYVVINLSCVCEFGFYNFRDSNTRVGEVSFC